jgi:hypothetical protein
MSMRRLALAGIAAIGIIGLAAIVAAASGRVGGPPSGDRQTVPAPIDRLEVVLRESNPPQVSLKVTAGLPSGCAQRDSHSVSRGGDTITVSVLNTMPKGNPICTMIYGQYDLSIDLGSGFVPGRTYTVQVNDKTTTFKT